MCHGQSTRSCILREKPGAGVTTNPGITGMQTSYMCHAESAEAVVCALALGWQQDQHGSCTILQAGLAVTWTPSAQGEDDCGAVSGEVPICPDDLRIASMDATLQFYQTWRAGKYTSCRWFAYWNPNFKWISNCHVWLAKDKGLQYVAVLTSQLGWWWAFAKVQIYPNVSSNLLG